jgi:1-acyl-sn-glycerol-3-phosphate acyltransferase
MARNQLAQLIELPGRFVASTADAVTAPIRPLLPMPNSVDEWGRDDHLVRLLSPLARLRWDVAVGGLNHLPARAGALLVTNDRRFTFSPMYVAWALSQSTGRPVRFVGRPDNAPFGAALRRIGALLSNPTEVHGALRAHQLVVIGAQPTGHPRLAGAIDHELVGAAVTAGVAVVPVASMSTPFGRAARVEVGPAVRPRKKRRGPLAEIEIAEATQHHLQRILDELGGVQTGMAPIDWLGEG